MKAQSEHFLQDTVIIYERLTDLIFHRLLLVYTADCMKLRNASLLIHTDNSIIPQKAVKHAKKSKIDNDDIGKVWYNYLIWALL